MQHMVLSVTDSFVRDSELLYALGNLGKCLQNFSIIFLSGNNFSLSQILCLAEQIKFTEDVENAIKDHSLHQIETELVNKLEHYTNIDTSSEDPGNTGMGKWAIPADFGLDNLGLA